MAKSPGASQPCKQEFLRITGSGLLCQLFSIHKIYVWTMPITVLGNREEQRSLGRGERESFGHAEFQNV